MRDDIGSRHAAHALELRSSIDCSAHRLLETFFISRHEQEPGGTVSDGAPRIVEGRCHDRLGHCHILIDFQRRVVHLADLQLDLAGIPYIEAGDVGRHSRTGEPPDEDHMLSECQLLHLGFQSLPHQAVANDHNVDINTGLVELGDCLEEKVEPGPRVQITDKANGKTRKRPLWLVPAGVEETRIHTIGNHHGFGAGNPAQVNDDLSQLVADTHQKITLLVRCSFQAAR